MFNVKANARTGQVASLGRYGGASSNVSVVGPPVLAASGLYHGHHTSVSPSTDTIPVSVHHGHQLLSLLELHHGHHTTDTTPRTLHRGHHISVPPGAGGPPPTYMLGLPSHPDLGRLAIVLRDSETSFGK